MTDQFNTTQSGTKGFESGLMKLVNGKSILKRTILLTYDILAVNLSVYLTLFTRFYVAHEFHPVSAHYFFYYGKYAPEYTLFCLIVFAAFKLYSGMWKYAGLNDLPRILAANAVTCVGHVVGTLACGIRMPITVYGISAVIQLCLVGGGRLAYRVLQVERDRFWAGRKASVNALIVGVGSNAHTTVRQLENESLVRPVCMLNYKEAAHYSVFAGIPVVNGVENLEKAIEKYHVNLVVLAAASISKEMKNQIREACRKLNVEVQSYSGFFDKSGSTVTLRNLAEYSSGAVEIVYNGHRKVYDDCEQALVEIEGSYAVKSITAKADMLAIELTDSRVVSNDLNEEWVKKQVQETGEEISFF